MASSIASTRQEQSVLVANGRVVFGWVRVLACRELGILVRAEVDDSIPDDESAHAIHRLQENTVRSVRTMTEMVVLHDELEPFVREKAREKQRLGGGDRRSADRQNGPSSVPATGSVNVPEPVADVALSTAIASGKVPEAIATDAVQRVEAGVQVRDALSQALGVDHRQVQHHRELLTLREDVQDDPEALAIVEDHVARSDRMPNTAGRQLSAAQKALRALEDRDEDEVRREAALRVMDQVVMKCTLAAEFLVEKIPFEDLVDAVAAVPSTVAVGTLIESLHEAAGVLTRASAAAGIRGEA